MSILGKLSSWIVDQVAPEEEKQTQKDPTDLNKSLGTGTVLTLSQGNIPQALSTLAGSKAAEFVYKNLGKYVVQEPIKTTTGLGQDVVEGVSKLAGRDVDTSFTPKSAVAKEIFGEEKVEPISKKIQQWNKRSIELAEKIQPQLKGRTDPAAIAGRLPIVATGALLFGGLKSTEFETGGGAATRKGVAKAKSAAEATAAYLSKLKKEQNLARIADSGNIKRLRSLYGNLKKQWVDSAAPIEDAIHAAEKRFGFQQLPSQNIRSQIDRVYRAPAIAEQYARSNGLHDIIKRAENFDDFNQYLIAKQATDVAEKGFETGRDVAKDQMLIKELAPKYEQLSQEVVGYSQKILDDSVDAGLLTRELADNLKKEYPNYVPLKRIFDELELEVIDTGAKAGAGAASIGQQNIVQRLKGSAREIEDPLTSLIDRTNSTVRQIERNKAAQILTSYEQLPGNPLGLKKLAPGEKAAADATISVYRNGVKEIWKADPEIARAARSVKPIEFGVIKQVVAAPVRALKLGATGLNLSFVLANIVKDQLFSFVTSKFSREAVNPVNFVTALMDTIGRGAEYQRWVSAGALSTSFDITRSQVAKTAQRIRAERSPQTYAYHLAKNPSELVRAMENVMGIGEEATRIQQAKNAEKAALRAGYSAKEAEALGAQAARENTANFMRRGEFGDVLNILIPYFNAGIQGSRAFIRAAERAPKETAIKVGLSLYMPMAVTTAWNMADPKRREVYEDISESEKERNFIIIPPVPTKNEDGTWKVIKVPLTPGYSSLAIPVRKLIEGFSGSEGVAPGDIAQTLIGTVSPIDIDVRGENVGAQLLMAATPQALKPGLEAYTNIRAFPAGENVPVVPYKLQGLPKKEQVKPTTSATARLIAGDWASPIKVEQFIKSSLAELGRIGLHYSDKLLVKLQDLPEEQVSGYGLKKSITRRFNQAYGGTKVNQYYESLDNLKKQRNSIKNRYAEVLLNGTDEEIDKMMDELVDHNIESTDTILKAFEDEIYTPADQKELKSQILQYTIEESELKNALKKAMQE